MSLRFAHWGTCEDCQTNIVVYPHPERATPVPPPVGCGHAGHDDDDWANTDCPVCGGYIAWGGADPVADVVVGAQ
jgi:ribosomal protein S27E